MDGSLNALAYELSLIDYKTETSADSKPSYYEATISVNNGDSVKITVNHPYNIRFGEDIYLASISENACVFQIVREPWRYFALAGIIMLLAGVLGMLNNAWCAVAACWMLGLFMGASSNFGLSGIVRYWRQEDFPSVYSGAPPLGTVIGAVFPFLVATIAAKFTYTGAFLFVAIMAVICIVCNRLFNPLGIAKYDNKLREAAGLPVDDLLVDRYNKEKAAK
jgi:hypothetical protein